jgi:hypothetical protein
LPQDHHKPHRERAPSAGSRPPKIIWRGDVAGNAPGSLRRVDRLGTIAITDTPGAQDFELAGGGLVSGMVRSDGIPVTRMENLVATANGDAIATR